MQNAEHIEVAIRAAQSDRRAHSADVPVGAVPASNRFGLCEPYLIKFYGTGGASPADMPLDTVTAKGRFGLVQPVLEIEGERYLLDIKFRMLQPHELAAAQGFPKSYQFEGNKTETVRQIGNAVPCGLARALAVAAL